MESWKYRKINRELEKMLPGICSVWSSFKLANKWMCWTAAKNCFKAPTIWQLQSSPWKVCYREGPAKELGNKCNSIYVFWCVRKQLNKQNKPKRGYCSPGNQYGVSPRCIRNIQLSGYGHQYGQYRQYGVSPRWIRRMPIWKKFKLKT